MRVFDRDMGNQLSWILTRGRAARADVDGEHEYPVSWAWTRNSSSWARREWSSESWSLNQDCYDEGWGWRPHPQGLPREDRIKTVIDRFNFEKVHQMMLAVNWNWAMSPAGVPSISEMKEEAARLLGDAFDSSNDDYWVSCGGFSARKKDGLLRLEFIADEAEE